MADNTGVVLTVVGTGRTYLDGRWVGAASGETFEVLDPGTGDVVGHVPVLSADEVEAAIDAASRALKTWRTTSALERSRILRRWLDLITENAPALATLISREQGKPVAEARKELDQARGFVDWYAEEAKRSYGDVIPSDRVERRMTVLRQPIGVVAAITPWNLPASMVARKLAPALAAGCTVVLKPAEDTPLSALALVALAAEAGVPAGVLNVVTGVPATIGGVLTASPAVRKLTFTGSTPVGKKLAEQSASTAKRVSLELGGNAPLIVFDDADLDLAVEGALISRFRNAGQTCTAANRIFVQSGIAQDFLALLTTKVAALKVGTGHEAGTDVGPLIHARARDGVTRLVETAVDEGARVIVGGEPVADTRSQYAPTVVAGVRDDMAIAVNEIFGPVASVLEFETEEEVIERANSTPYGLAAYFYTEDHRRMVRVTDALDFGMVGVNESLVAYEGAPFGGMKESGYGREGSHYGLDDYTELKYVCLGGLS